MHVSSRGIVIQDGKIVLIHRRKRDQEENFRDYYLIPGGKLEPGETEIEALKREMREELGIEIEPGEKILEYQSHFNNSVQNFYRCQYKSGILGTGDGPEFKNKMENGELLEIEKVDLKDIDSINLVPRIIKKEIMKLTMKRAYSYYIIKPDGIRFFPEIFQELNDNFESVKFFKIDDFSTTIKKLYFRHYERKGQAFANVFDQYLQSSNSLYGNEAILAVVSERTQEEYEEFRKKVFELKMKLRDRFSNHNIRILSNIPSKNMSNYVRIIDEQGNDVKQRSFREKGNYRINELNVIHSPDSDKQSTVEELNILCELGIIREDRIISQRALKELIRFRTITGYETDTDEIKPEISGFINNDIENSINER